MTTTMSISMLDQWLLVRDGFLAETRQGVKLTQDGYHRLFLAKLSDKRSRNVSDTTLDFKPIRFEHDCHKLCKIIPWDIHWDD
ncbi:MAG: hypothetical protein JW908_03400 [Anaerolineales bacterium]|nr:hypothetical protein [Anaerolineales bacterium]